MAKSRFSKRRNSQGGTQMSRQAKLRRKEAEETLKELDDNKYAPQSSPAVKDLVRKKECLTSVPGIFTSDRQLEQERLEKTQKESEEREEEYQERLNNLPKKAFKRGFAKGFAKGLLAASIIALIAGGIGLLTVSTWGIAPFVLIMFAMAGFQGFKEGFSYYRKVKDLDESQKKNKKYWNYLEASFDCLFAAGAVILTAGAALVSYITAGLTGFLSGFYAKRNYTKSQYYQETRPKIQGGITGSLAGIAIGVVIAACVFSGPFGLAALGIIVAGAAVGMMVGYGAVSLLKSYVRYDEPTAPLKSTIQSDKWDTGSLLSAAVVAVTAVALFASAVFTGGLSIAVGIGIVATVAFVTRYVIPYCVKKFSQPKEPPIVQEQLNTSQKKIKECLDKDIDCFTVKKGYFGDVYENGMPVYTVRKEQKQDSSYDADYNRPTVPVLDPEEDSMNEYDADNNNNINSHGYTRKSPILQH